MTDEAPRPPPPPAPPPAPAPAPPPRFRRIGAALLAATVCAAVAVVILRVRARERLRAESSRRAQEVDRGPRVFVARVRALPGARELRIPAEVRAFYQSTVYAKVAGYVKSIRVDKGDHVRKGDVLGRLESPEVDQQVLAAESDALIKQRTFERYKTLVAKDYVAQQDYETVKAQYDVSLAVLRQARALQAYEILRAPFDGTVTARYVDPGALIPAATGGTVSAQPLVDVADLRRLRVLLYVQQDAAPFVRVGDPVTLVEDQRPEMRLDATVTRVSKALDPRSRAMLCEIWLDNRFGLYPGTFMHATLRLHAPALPTVPSTALLFRKDRSAVAVLHGSRIKVVPVETGIDDGQTVQLRSGVSAGEWVALNLPSEVLDGAVVRALPVEGPPGEPPARGPRQGQRGPRPPRGPEP